MRDLRWASHSRGRFEVNGRPAGPRAVAMLRRLFAQESDVDVDAVVEQWYRLSRIRSAYRAKSRGGVAVADLDDLTRDQLPPDARAVADALDDWLVRHHGVMSSHHNAGSFLDLLRELGYEVRRIPPAGSVTLTNLVITGPSPDAARAAGYSAGLRDGYEAGRRGRRG